MTVNDVIQISASMIGSLGFAVLFNVRGAKKLLAISLGGGFGRALFLSLCLVIDSSMLCHFIVALTVSFYAELMARVLKSPATVFTAPCLIPMMPGASLYYTMAYALGEDMDGFLTRGIATLQIATALAVGIIVATVVMRLLLKVVPLLKKRMGAAH